MSDALMDPVHTTSLGDVLRQHRRSYPDREAVTCHQTRLTFVDLDERVNRLANAFQARGVTVGERVLWLGQNCHRLLETILAAAKLGAVVCPANWRQAPEELAFVIEDVAPRLVLWQEAETGETVTAARERSDPALEWIQHDSDDAGGYEQMVASAHPHDHEAWVDPQTPVLQLYTAAFSGRPNGALISHEALLTQAVMVAMLADLSSETVYLNCGPLFHVATLMNTFATFVFAGRNVFTPRADAEEICRLVDQERVTNAFVVGPTIDQITELNRGGKYDLSSLRSGRASGDWAQMVSPDTSPMARAPGGYGQTELMGLVLFSSVGGPAVGAHGRPFPLAQVRIVDPDGTEVPAGETGEIVVRGPMVMNEYHRRPDANRQRQSGGWHHTHDIGRLEKDGSVTFIGPKTRLIKSAVENIYPSEVEGCINSHPSVRESAVIGVPDPRWTQNVKAIVVVKEGESLTEDEVIEHCRQHLASYKKPKSVEFVEQLPRQGMAVDYDRLDSLFGGGGYPGAGR